MGDSDMFERRSPVDGRLTWRGTLLSRDQIHHVAASSEKGCEAWRRVKMEDRIAIVRRYAEFLGSHREAISETITLESGKPLWESRTEVSAAMSKVENSIEALLSRRWTLRKEEMEQQTVVRFNPLGPVLVLGPYNLPLHLPGAHVIPALLAGNSVVLKPSEKSPAVGDWIQRGLKESGVPTTAFQLVHGGADTATCLLESHRFSGVFFTGSYRAGLSIHKRMSDFPQCNVALEMGGNNPLVIDDVPHRVAAIHLVIQSSFITSGQRCTCARRIIVVDKPQNREWLEECVKSVSKVRVGNPLDEASPFMGALVTEEAADAIMRTEEGWRALGAKPLLRSRRSTMIPAVLHPGVWDTTDIHLEDEEHFGPLVSVQFVPDFRSAIDVANATRFGLSAALISSSRERFEEFVSEVRAGIINWNSPTTGASGRLPFGGVGASGNHKPSGYFAADYCSYPVASVEVAPSGMSVSTLPGLEQ